MTTENQNAENETADSEVDMSCLVRRLGRFRIPRQLVLEQPENIRPFLAECVIVEAQVRWEFDSIEYLAMSERFDEIGAGMQAPEYTATFERDEDGLVSLKSVERSTANMED